MAGKIDLVGEAHGAQHRRIDLEAGRRGFLAAIGLGTLGASLMGPGSVRPASAQAITDADILNFTLNLEYLGAEFYLRASTGQGLRDSEVQGVGTLGPLAGGRQVPFQSSVVANFANEIAADERGHVRAVRSLLGGAAVARPSIDLAIAFTFAARAAGLVPPDGIFDPYLNDNSFLIAGFIFEDVCVTALKGSSANIVDKTILSNAAGLLATEGYHAGGLRTLLTERGLFAEGAGISNARNAVNPGTFSDQGLGNTMTSNVAPTDQDGLAFGRTPQQVLNIVYLNAQTRPTGFFPNGLNGTIR